MNRQWWNTARMGKNNDGRVKYTEEDKRRIKQLHKEGYSQRKIAVEIGCSRRYVQFVLYPEKRGQVAKRAIEVKRWEKYNTKDLRRGTMRKYRAKLRKVHNIN